MNSYKMNLNRRKFLTNTTAAVGGIGMAFATVPLLVHGYLAQRQKL
jgi:hypothetical protein